MTKSWWLALFTQQTLGDWQKVFGWVYLPSNNEEVRTNFKLPRLKNKFILCAHMAREVEDFQPKNWTYSHTNFTSIEDNVMIGTWLTYVGMKEFLDKSIYLYSLQ